MRKLRHHDEEGKGDSERQRLAASAVNGGGGSGRGGEEAMDELGNRAGQAWDPHDANVQWACLWCTAAREGSGTRGRALMWRAISADGERT
jgi:hypothetical protein